jgi:hypothetical protein
MPALEPSPAARLRPVAVGDRVRFIGPTAMRSPHHSVPVGLAGTVREVRFDRLAIEFDEELPDGHSCSLGLGHRGFYVIISEVEVLLPRPPIDVAPAPASVPARPQPRLRVDLRQVDGQWQLEITNGPAMELITGNMVRPYLPREYHKLIRRKHRWERILPRFVQYAIEDLIPPEVLVDAIRSCCIAIQKRDQQGVFSSEQGLSDDYLKLIDDITSEPPLIAIGDKLFSLTPRGVINGSRGLEMLRKRVVQKAREGAARMLTTAQAEARTIVSTAETQAQSARAELERERVRMQVDAASILPEWIRAGGHAVMKGQWTNYPWMIAIWVSMKIDRFELADGDRIYHWNAVAIPSPRKIMLWLPINPSTGDYKYNGTSHGCRVWYSGDDSDNGRTYNYLPHINHSGCCMELQGTPAAIKGPEDLAKLVTIIERGMKVVNMSSLLSRYPQWHKDIQDQTPAPVKRYYDGELNLSGLLETSADHVDVAAEAREIFSTEDVERRVREARERSERARVARDATNAAAPAGLRIDPTEEDVEEAAVFEVPREE